MPVQASEGATTDALLPNPELLILDEPSNGLDPSGIIELRQLIQHLNKAYGMTIVVSSHLLNEVEKIVTDVGIIYKGKMIFQGSLPALHLFQQKRSRLIIDTSDNNRAIEVLQDRLPERSGDALSIAFEGPHQVALINRLLIEQGIDVYLLEPQKNNLEQLFIDLTTP